MLNFKHLRYFWAVAREGNLTRAAQSLGVSQSALSIQIKHLEERLGHELFDRSGRSLILTEAGRIAMDHAETMFALEDELVSTLNDSARGHRSVLKVGALSTLSRNLQIEFLGPVLKDADLELTVVSGTFEGLLPSLATHKLDVILTNGMPPRSDADHWVAHTIRSQPVSLIGHGTPVPDHRALVSLLRTAPLIVPAHGTSIRSGFDGWASERGIKPRIMAEIDDMALIRLMARTQVGLAVIPPIVVKDELESGRLTEIAKLDGLEEHFLAITQDRRFPNPLLKRLIGQAD